MKRKVVQIHRNGDILTALCSDGTMWERNLGDISHRLTVKENGEVTSSSIVHSLWVEIENVPDLDLVQGLKSS